jgi:hypothetical protein
MGDKLYPYTKHSSRINTNDNTTRARLLEYLRGMAKKRWQRRL